jgi:signal transduction histidine kinase/ligand-binding sensor domain-containing protein/ActR/RegA family two-component response regulator
MASACLHEPHRPHAPSALRSWRGPRTPCLRLLALALLAGVLGGGGSAAALDPGKSLNQFPHRVWQTADGLPQNSILAMVQTPDGYLWGGTWEGLVRFDGANFKVFDKTNTPELPGRSVRNLVLGQDGTLWLGLDEGLVSMREGSFHHHAPPPGTVLREIRSMLVSRDGSLWIATEGYGLTRLSGGRFHTWKTAEGLASDEVLAIAEDAAGALWVGGAGGLQRWTGSAWTAPLPFEGVDVAPVRAVAFDLEDTLWAGTEQGLIYRLQDGRMRHVPEASLPGGPISVMIVDRSGTLWIGSLGKGLLRWAKGQCSVIDSPGHALAGSVVNDLREDQEGNLWVGTEGRGLHRLKDAPFTSYGPLEGLSHEMVLAIYEARDGSLWFATVGGGVTRLHEGRMTAWTTREGLILDRVRSIAETPDGSMWFGTRSGISRWRDGVITSFTAAQGLQDARAFMLATDSEGTLWVGTPTGLSRWNGERFEPFTPVTGPALQQLSLLSPSAAGGLWVGTNSGALAHLVRGSLEVLVPERGPLSSAPQTILDDGAGVLWIGTNEGLFRWKAGLLRRFTSAEGLFDDRIFQILADGSGHLWMSCNKGIFRVAVAELDAVATGRLARVTPRAYGAEDGMRSEECNALGSPAGWRDRGGRLWFPTIRGAVAYTPGSEEKRTRPPRVLIEELWVDGRAVPTLDSQQGELPAGKGQVEIHYTSAGLRAPQQLRFRYRLEGIDADWVNAGTRRVAWYSNLPPGRYRFHVAAEYADGGGEAPGAELTLHLKPRLTQTWAFRVACALAAALGVAGLEWLRIYRLRQRERELQDRVDQRTTELATVNADLKTRLQELQDTRERLVHAEKLAAVGTLAAGVGHELNNPLAFVISNLHYVASEVREVSARQPDRARWEDMQQALDEALQGTDRMRRIIQDLRTFSRAQPQRPRQVELHGVLELALSMADAEVRHRARVVKDYGAPPRVLGDETQLGQVFLNLLVNAAQAIPEGHADQHEIRITTRRDERGQAVVSVSDTGSGIPPEVLPRIFEPFFTTKPVGVGTGLGLSICHSHVQAMGGDIHVRSEHGRGTTFEVVLPPAPEFLPAEPPPDSPPASDSPSPKGRLMIIDDEPLLTTALTRMLAPEHEVVAFTRARQALERLRAGERFELILCDLMMPEMTGMELHETLAREAPELAGRMVFITGGAFTEAARAFLDTTPLPCLEKPFEPEALRARIRALLAERKRTAA